MKTYEAKIYCGLRVGYTEQVFDIDMLKSMARAHVDNFEPFCVTVTETTFIYVGGEEQGAIVGLIQYPRFPDSEAAIKRKALELAEKLMVTLGQNRVSVVCTDETIMLGGE